MSIRRRLMMADIGERPLPDYFSFTALTEGNFTLTIPKDLSTSNLSYVEYSTDEGESWVKTENVESTKVTITTPTIEIGSRILWRGNGVRYATGISVRSIFTATCNFSASGHIQSLIFIDQVNKNTVSSKQFLGLFYGTGTRLRDAKNVIFPTECGEQSFTSMFRDNTYLTQGPWIPVSYVSLNGMREMFSGCTRLQRVVNLSTSSSSGAFYNWLNNVPTSSLLVVNYNASSSHVSTINARGLNYIYYRSSDNKYFLSDKTTECDEDGNPLT